LDIDAVRCLSLKGSTIDGHIRTSWTKSRKPNYDIIKAVLDNGGTPEEKSQQFLILKQNFAALGQYDHEDRAFSNFMRARQTNVVTHVILDVLRRIGDYGASPGRLFLTILGTWALFGSVYLLWAWSEPAAFTFGGWDGIRSVLSAGLLSASRLMNLSADVQPASWLSNVVCVFEGTVGWFLLAMFSVAIVRKTLR